MIPNPKLLPLFERFIDTLHAEGYFRNCTECFNWNEQKEICKLANQRPPAKVIVKGCPEYDPIPF